MNPSIFQRRLLKWYRKNRRSLPWRKSRDPYAIWVSEAMLQQTQVATVIPYYQRFLQRFPTISALSRAHISEVLDHWAGLGYYSRAKNLHAGAQMVMERFGGRVPCEESSLRQLPGIGRYTAGAIASIAFDRPTPIVDGNVVRVLCRLWGIAQDPRQPQVQRRLWQLSAQLIPVEAPGDFNQGLMELGAMVCLPRNPLCGKCPVALDCIARKKNWQDRIPPVRKGLSRKKILYLCAILQKDHRVLLARRPLSGLLPGLWEFPGGEMAQLTSPSEELGRLLKERLGIQVHSAQAQGTVHQTLTHRDLEIHVFRCQWKGRLRSRPAWYQETCWAPIPQLIQQSLTAGMSKVAKRLSDSES